MMEILKRKGYDMHCHTAASDGKLPLRELVDFAKSTALSGFAVTDHDILDASKEARHASESSGIEVIPGVELSGKIENYLIEVIGYFVNPFDKSLEELCKVNRDFRGARMRKIIYSINEKYPARLEKEITYEEVLSVSKDGSIGLNHINQILVSRGIFKEREAFYSWLDSKGGPESCYCERDAIDLEQAINAIISAGGVVGIPHPALVHFDYPELSDGNFVDMLKKFIDDKRIRVIETEYPYSRVRDECAHMGEQEDFWRLVANEYGLIGVGGSDGHQKPKGPSLGEKITKNKTVEKIRKLSRKT